MAELLFHCIFFYFNTIKETPDDPTCKMLKCAMTQKNRTDEAALSHVEVIATRGDPHATEVGTDQAWVTLRLLPKKRHTQALGNPFHGSLGGRGDTLSGLDQCLEEAALLEHHIIRDVHLHGTSAG